VGVPRFVSIGGSRSIFSKQSGWREVVVGVIQAIMGIGLLVIIARFLGLLD
jgi:hypothetical protein